MVFFFIIFSLFFLFQYYNNLPSSVFITIPREEFESIKPFDFSTTVVVSKSVPRDASYVPLQTDKYNQIYFIYCFIYLFIHIDLIFFFSSFFLFVFFFFLLEFAIPLFNMVQNFLTYLVYQMM
jgi:hypothetical protein